jgi:hypothetical protein
MKKDSAKKGTKPIEHAAVPARRAPHVKMPIVFKSRLLGLRVPASLHEEKPLKGVGYFHVLIERVGSMCIAHCLERGFVSSAATAGQALEEMRQAIRSHSEYLRENPGVVTYTSPDSIFEKFVAIAGWTGNPRAAVLQHTANALLGLRFQLSKRNRKWIEEAEVRKIINTRLNNYDPKKSIPVEELRKKWGL